MLVVYTNQDKIVWRGGGGEMLLLSFFSKQIAKLGYYIVELQWRGLRSSNPFPLPTFVTYPTSFHIAVVSDNTTILYFCIILSHSGLMEWLAGRCWAVGRTLTPPSTLPISWCRYMGATKWKNQRTQPAQTKCEWLHAVWIHYFTGQNVGISCYTFFTCLKTDHVSFCDLLQ